MHLLTEFKKKKPLLISAICAGEATRLRAQRLIQLPVAQVGDTVPGHAVLGRGKAPRQHVVALEVAVNDATGVEVDQGAAYLHGRLLHHERPQRAHMLLVVVEDLFEVAERRQLQYDCQRPHRQAQHGHDVRVAQVAQDGYLLAGDSVRFGGQLDRFAVVPIVHKLTLYMNMYIINSFTLSKFLITFNWNMVLKISNTFFLLLYMSNKKSK